MHFVNRICSRDERRSFPSHSFDSRATILQQETPDDREECEIGGEEMGPARGPYTNFHIIVIL